MSRLLALAVLLAALVGALATTPDASSLDLPAILPAVTATTPVADEHDVAPNVRPTATFTLPMDGATINAKSFTLTGPDGPVAASVSYNPDSSSATLAPTGLLERGATYRAQLDTSVTSLTGFALADVVSWAFTVLPPPAVLTTDPVPGAEDVDHFVRPAAAFTQPMDPASINRSTFTIAKPGGAPLLTNVAYSPLTGVAKLVPLFPLDYAATYVLTLSEGVKGVDGTPLAAPYSWELTTSSKPYVRRVDSGGAGYGTLAGVSFDPDSFVKGGLPRLSANPIALTDDDLLYQTERYGLWSYVFSVPNGAYTVRTHHAETLKTGARQRVFGIDVLETANADAPSIDLYAAAGPNAAYSRCFSVTTTTSRIQVRATPVIGDPQISAIEVVPASQTVGVSQTVPAAGATGVTSTSTVKATFSSAIDPSSLTTSTFQLKRFGSVVPALVSYDPVQRVATLTPSAPLAGRTTYSASIAQTVRDSDSCPTAGAGWSFTTR